MRNTSLTNDNYDADNDDGDVKIVNAGPHPATQLLQLPSPLLPQTSRFTLIIAMISVVTRSKLLFLLMTRTHSSRDARIVTAGEHVMEKIKMTAS